MNEAYLASIVLGFIIVVAFTYPFYMRKSKKKNKFN